MAHTDLSFYQSVLRNLGIKYVFSQKPEITDTKTRPDQLSQHLDTTESGPSRPNNHGKQVVDPGLEADHDKDIPQALMEYRRPAYSVWSYYNLPEDIQKGFTNPRCDLITKIIGNLKWSKRTYTLWPLSTLKKNMIVPDTDLFFQGITLIKPVHIFIFGSKAFKVLLKDREYAYGQHYIDNHQIIVLPDLDCLLPDNRVLKTMVWNILKQYSPPRY